MSKQIGLRYKKLRESLDLTQRELARELGITAPQISVLERGKREPSTNELKVYAKKFNVPMEYLLGLSNCRSGYYTKISEELKLNDDAINMLKRSNIFNLKIAQLINDLCSTEEGVEILRVMANYLYDDYLYFDVGEKKEDSVYITCADGEKEELNIYDIENGVAFNNLLFRLSCFKQNRKPLNLRPLE